MRPLTPGPPGGGRSVQDATFGSQGEVTHASICVQVCPSPVKPVLHGRQVRPAVEPSAGGGRSWHPLAFGSQGDVRHASICEQVCPSPAYPTMQPWHERPSVVFRAGAGLSTHPSEFLSQGKATHASISMQEPISPVPESPGLQVHVLPVGELSPSALSVQTASASQGKPLQASIWEQEAVPVNVPANVHARVFVSRKPGLHVTAQAGEFVVAEEQTERALGTAGGLAHATSGAMGMVFEA